MADPSQTPLRPPPQGPSLLDALVARLGGRVPWRRGAWWAVLVAVAVCAGFVLSPGLYAQQVPALSEEDLGRPFRSASPAGFKAARDYEVVHDRLTERRRDEARTAVRPVFDYNPAVAQDVRGAVRDAFGTMRTRLEPAPPPVDPTEEAARRAATEPGALAAEFQERLFGRPDAALEPEDLQALRAARFGSEVEAAVLTLLERAYGTAEAGGSVGYVASSREELTREGPQGLTLRHARAAQETALGPASPQVLDVREAHEALDRFASVPGNLLPDNPGSLRRAALRLAKRLVRPNIAFNLTETDARRAAAAGAVKDAVISIKKGQRVIGDGELVNEGHLVVLRGMRAQTDELDLVTLQVGTTGLVALLVAAAWAFCRAAFRRFRPARKDALLLGVLLVGTLALVRLWVAVADAVQDRYEALPLEALYYAAPVAAGAMLVRFLLSDELALLFALVVSVLVGVLLGNSLAVAAWALITSLVAAQRVARAKDRVGIFRAAAVTGAVSAAAVLVLGLLEGKPPGADALLTAAFAFGGCALGLPVLVMAVTPMAEAVFGYASDIKLLELANLNHPALKELIVQAPGTYHHSIVIGTLVENAAEAIGANPLLARSCAYYHDIGKGKSPLYFGENQKGDNPHDRLAPAMSAVIIKRHVTEGLEMARQYRLPRKVADAIPQHHGTRLVGYFFHKALKEQEGKEGAPPLDESIYRYPGPKPQFVEAALVMIADAVEASCRSLPEPTTPRLHAQVQKMINVIFGEGQLDDCDLTLRDLHLITESFVRTLEGIYHTRPEYPAGAVGGGPGLRGVPPALAVAAPPAPVQRAPVTKARN